MLGMMNKGSGMTNQPVPGNPGMGMPQQGGNPLAALFMGNSAVNPASAPAMLPQIQQPRQPIVDPVQTPRILPQPAAPAPMAPITNRAQMLGANQAGRLTPEMLERYKRSMMPGGYYRGQGAGRR